MNTKEMRELDAWVCENVLGLDVSKYPIMHEHVDIKSRSVSTYVEDLPTPTVDAAAAILVLKKCAERYDCLICDRMKWRVKTWDDLIVGDDADTLPLAICLFAKKLFDNQSSSK